MDISTESESGIEAYRKIIKLKTVNDNFHKKILLTVFESRVTIY